MTPEQELIELQEKYNSITANISNLLHDFYPNISDNGEEITPEQSLNAIRAMLVMAHNGITPRQRKNQNPFVWQMKTAITNELIEMLKEIIPPKDDEETK